MATDLPLPLNHSFALYSKNEFWGGVKEKFNNACYYVIQKLSMLIFSKH